MKKNFFTSLKNVLGRFWRWRWRNYILALLLFAAWMLFLSPNTVFTQYKARKENRELRKLRNFYLDEIKHNEQLIEKFHTDPDFVETYGRENYLMKAPDEDIYLFPEE